MTHEAGKGDKTRPTNWDHFSENFDRIFGSKQAVTDTVEDADEDEDEDEEYEDEICSGCSGSGEGMWDGATCTKCHGCGVEPTEKENDYDV